MAQGLKIKIGADSAQFDRTMKGVRGKLDAIKGPIKAAGVAAAAARRQWQAWQPGWVC